MNPTLEPACERCHYFRKGDALTGNCHRYPPVFAGDSSPRELHHWRYPIVGMHGWCGEFVPAPQAPVPAGEITL